MEVVASLSQGRTAAAQCGLFTQKSVPVIFESPCTCTYLNLVMLPQESYCPYTIHVNGPSKFSRYNTGLAADDNLAAVFYV